MNPHSLLLFFPISLPLRDTRLKQGTGVGGAMPVPKKGQFGSKPNAPNARSHCVALFILKQSGKHLITSAHPSVEKVIKYLPD
jgi:hypothetical protein